MYKNFYDPKSIISNNQTRTEIDDINCRFFFCFLKKCICL